jgi:SAM-dependent methyltransferase
MYSSAFGSVQAGVLEQALHHHLTRVQQGLLPSSINPYKLKNVLDLHCRSGAWAIDFALTYPGISITGLDDDLELIELARSNARSGYLKQVLFYENSSSKPIRFEDNSFDLVHIGRPFLFSPAATWSALLQKCKQVMKPGAFINLVHLSPGMGASEDYQRMLELWDQVLFLRGCSFFDNQESASPGVHLCRLLREAGFENVTYSLYPVNFGSWNEKSGTACYQILLNLIESHKSLFLDHHLIDAHNFDRLIANQRADIRKGNICVTGVMISVVGVKGGNPR